MATTAPPQDTNGTAPTEPIDSTLIAPPEMTLAERLARITAEVAPVAKSGRNQHFGYSYQRAEDVGAAVAPLLGRYAVSITPRIEHASIRIEDTGRTTNSGIAIKDYFVPMVFRLACPTGHDDVPWLALATDDSDKGVNKAITAAVKSFLRAHFLIPTGEDDTDAGGSHQGSGGASSHQGGGTGELPDVGADAGVSGTLAVIGGGRIAFQYRAEDRGAWNAIKDAIKDIPGRRFDSDTKVWSVGADQSGTAVVLARHLGLTVPEPLASEHPATPADDLPTTDPMDLPPSAGRPTNAGGGGSSDDDIPFAPSYI